MQFKTLFLAHAPEAEAKKHRATLETSLYKLLVVIVPNEPQAVQVAKEMVETEGIHSVLLCPGFTHAEVAEIQEAVKGRAGVYVARGDGPSAKMVQKVMEEVGWFRR